MDTTVMYEALRTLRTARIFPRRTISVEVVGFYWPHPRRPRLPLSLDPASWWIRRFCTRPVELYEISRNFPTRTRSVEVVGFYWPSHSRPCLPLSLDPGSWWIRRFCTRPCKVYEIRGFCPGEPPLGLKGTPFSTPVFGTIRYRRSRCWCDWMRLSLEEDYAAAADLVGGAGCGLMDSKLY
jgi:hypothetical protein